MAQTVAKTAPVSVKLVEQVEELSEIQKKLEAALTQRYQMAQGVKRDGKEIVVPSFMTLKDAAKAITSFEEEMETEEETIIELYAHPYDACNAFHRAVSEVYGQMLSASSQSFFGTMPGRCLTVPTSHNTSIKVPLGNAKVPGLPINMRIDVMDPAAWTPGERGGFIKFTHKRMYAPMIQDIEARTKAILAKESIFQGKAINSGYEFIDITGFSRESVIYSQEQERQLRANVFTLIEHTSRAQAANIPLKRGILLHGPYGTGKTLTALYTASLCVEHGWSFILVRTTDSIDAAIQMAQKIQPACVFFEDIDAAAGEERDADVNAILNTIDGVLSKDSKVVVILTTNHIEKVSPAMLRPGRLDAVIKLGELDDPGIIKFISANMTNAHGVTMLRDHLDSKAICAAAAGYTPAFLKEAVSKATLYSIARGERQICSADIVDALNELRPQWELMAGPRDVKKITLEDTLRTLVTDVATNVVESAQILDGDNDKTNWSLQTTA